MSHIWIGHIRMSHVTRMNGSCHIRMSHVTHVNRCMLHTWMGHIHIWVVSYMNIISCVWHIHIHTYACDSIIHLNASLHIYDWVMGHIYDWVMGHISIHRHIFQSYISVLPVILMIASCRIYESIIPRTYMSHVTHFVCVMSHTWHVTSHTLHDAHTYASFRIYT